MCRHTCLFALLQRKHHVHRLAAALKHYDCVALLTLMTQLYIINTRKWFEEDIREYKDSGN